MCSAGGPAGSGASHNLSIIERLSAGKKADPFVVINPRNEFSGSLRTCGAGALIACERPSGDENAKRWKVQRRAADASDSRRTADVIGHNSDRRRRKQRHTHTVTHIHAHRRKKAPRSINLLSINCQQHRH